MLDTEGENSLARVVLWSLLNTALLTRYSQDAAMQEEGFLHKLLLPQEPLCKRDYKK